MRRTQFHEQLEQVELDMLSLGELAGAAVKRSVDALVGSDEAEAKSVIAGDDEIDELYLKVDSSILQMLALQSPVAGELRLISAMLHSALHLERIGDQAVNVAKIHLATKDLRAAPPLRRHIADMVAVGGGMGLPPMAACARRDLELCMRLQSMDDPVDRLNRATHLEALKLAGDQRSLEWGLHMNLVARALERVGDNAVDIGEQVAFLVTGEFTEFTDASHGAGDV